MKNWPPVVLSTWKIPTVPPRSTRQKGMGQKGERPGVFCFFFFEGRKAEKTQGWHKGGTISVFEWILI